MANEHVVTISKEGIRAKKSTKDADKAWADILASEKSKKDYLTGVLDTVEPIRISESETIIVGVVNYHGFRVVIPMTEMNIILKEPSKDRTARIMSSMIGSEVDFVVTATDNKERKCTGSRKIAMERKRKENYFPSGKNEPKLKEGTVVEARVTAVGETAIRVEVMGAECFVRCNRLDPEWISNAKEKYFVGQILDVRMDKIEIEDGDIKKIEVEARSLRAEDEATCSVSGRYLGKVTGRDGATYYIRLKAGVNAIAYQYTGTTPFPEIDDEVKFICTKYDKGSHLAIGIINQVVRTN